MNTALPTVNLSTDAPFTIERTFNAPLAQVWRAFTDREQLAQWMSPAGLTPAASSLELRVGGLYHYGMQAPNGFVMWGKWTFLEITPPGQGTAKLVVIVSFSDENKGVTRHPMAPEWPLQTLSTSTFTAQGDKTLLQLKWQACNASSAEQAAFNAGHAGMTMGWSGTMAQLEDWLAKVQA
jgi:uncharacterized protein YndB with AHSA1/START domain